MVMMLSPEGKVSMLSLVVMGMTILMGVRMMMFSLVTMEMILLLEVRGMIISVVVTGMMRWMVV